MYWSLTRKDRKRYLRICPFGNCMNTSILCALFNFVFFDNFCKLMGNELYPHHYRRSLAQYQNFSLYCVAEPVLFPFFGRLWAYGIQPAPTRDSTFFHHQPQTFSNFKTTKRVNSGSSKKTWLGNTLYWNRYRYFLMLISLNLLLLYKICREVGDNPHFWDYPVYCSDGISWTNQLLIGKNLESDELISSVLIKSLAGI